jgi:sugar-specific transcriptional regulator TrmB
MKNPALSSTDIKRIYSLLEKLGCNKREVDIYLQSLQLGPSSVQELARRLKQNRVTVHSAAQQMIEKGFLFETRKGKRRLLVAETPGALRQFLQKKEQELDVLKESVDYVSEILIRMNRHERNTVTTKMYEGAEGVKRMLEESLQATTKKMYVFSYSQRISEIVDPAYLERYFARRSKKGITSQLILAPGEFSKKMKTKQQQYKTEIRFLAPNVHWRSGIFSWDNTVAIMSYTEGKVTCTVIDSEDIAVFFQKIMFDLCWQQTKA